MLHHIVTILVCYGGQKSSDLGKIWFPSRLWCCELIFIVWEPCYDPSDHIISCFMLFSFFFSWKNRIDIIFSFIFLCITYLILIFQTTYDKAYSYNEKHRSLMLFILNFEHGLARNFFPSSFSVKINFFLIFFYCIYWLMQCLHYANFVYLQCMSLRLRV
jgi:uncharacterized membrane protein YwzB